MNPEDFRKQQKAIQSWNNEYRVWQGNRVRKNRKWLTSPVAKSKKYTKLMLVIKRACDIIRPIILKVYASINQTKRKLSKLKEDKSRLTIVDGLVQHFLAVCLFENGKVLKGIVGEEDFSSVNISHVPYTVEDISIPFELNPDINKIRKQIQALRPALSGKDYKDVVLFIDPIDGTNMFLHNRGQECCVMVGAALNGKVVAGLLYRPLTEIPEYAIGCREENTKLHNLMLQKPANHNTDKAIPKIFLTSPSKVSDFIDCLIEELDMDRAAYGSVGNKVLCMLEGKGHCYIQDRGTARWDICAPQAVIEAWGGCFSRLTTFIENGKLDSYSYNDIGYEAVNEDIQVVLKSSPELWPNLTRYNSTLEGVYGRLTNDKIHFVRAYSNLCGFVCLSKEGIEILDEYQRAIERALNQAKPNIS